MTARHVFNFTFHGIGEPPSGHAPSEARYWITRDAFERALDIVAGRRDVRITFDDGNESDVRVALPALTARRSSASFFVPAAVVGRPGYVDGVGLRELVAAGMTVGSHGMLHRPWVGLSPAAEREEYDDARDRLAEIVGRPVDEAACPFGAYDRRSLRLLREAGYRRVYTSDRGPARANAWLQPRNTVEHEDSPADLERALASPPRGLPALLRALRLAVKRWR